MKKHSRLAFLDALRGIAAFSVLLYHLFADTVPSFHAFTVNDFNLGDFGVYLFFMISGFIIPVSMERHPALGSFWRSRFFRLFPPFWLSLAIAVTLGALGAIKLEEGYFLHPVRNTLANTTMFALLLHMPQALGVYWTLAIELIFYVLCSALKLTKLLEKRLMVTYIGVALYLLAVAACASGHFRGSHLQATYGGLLLTAMLGSVAYQTYIGKVKPLSLIVLTPIVLAAILSGIWLRYGLNAQAKDGVYFGFHALANAWVAAIAFFFVVFACRNVNFARPLLWLGRISYSLYLMHAMCVQLVTHLGLPQWLFYIVAVAFSLAIAELCFRFIEKPFSALASRTKSTSTAATT